MDIILWLQSELRRMKLLFQRPPPPPPPLSPPPSREKRGEVIYIPRSVSSSDVDDARAFRGKENDPICGASSSIAFSYDFECIAAAVLGPNFIAPCILGLATIGGGSHCQTAFP